MLFRRNGCEEEQREVASRHGVGSWVREICCMMEGVWQRLYVGRFKMARIEESEQGRNRGLLACLSGPA